MSEDEKIKVPFWEPLPYSYGMLIECNHEKPLLSGEFSEIIWWSLDMWRKAKQIFEEANEDCNSASGQ